DRPNTARHFSAGATVERGGCRAMEAPRAALARRFVGVEADDGRALGGGACRDRFADPGSGADYRRNFSVESKQCVVLYFFKSRAAVMPATLFACVAARTTASASASPASAPTSVTSASPVHRPAASEKTVSPSPAVCEGTIGP